MSTAAIFGQGISFPPRLGQDGRVAWSSGPANIRESLRVILLTQRGERMMLPSFGGRLRTYLAEPNVPATHQAIQQEIQTAISLWEPRITVVSVSVDPDPVNPRAAIATIQYRLVASQNIEQVNLTLQLSA